MVGALSGSAIRSAAAEYDNLGQEAFLTKYGYGRATDYVVEIDGRFYDAKAIAGVAQSIQHPERKVPAPSTFNGGLDLLPAFERAGFQISKRQQASTPIAKYFEQILENYQSQRSGPFSGSGTIQTAFKSAVRSIEALPAVASRRSVSVQHSYGKGNWAAVPWIAILDSRETSNIKRGVYVVFLFRADMTGWYLTIAQGITELAGSLSRADMRTTLHSTSDVVRKIAGDRLANASFKPDNSIDLKSTTTLANNYALGTVTHKLYAAGDSPSDNRINDDLDKLLEIVDDYIGDRNQEITAKPNPSFSDVALSFREAVDDSGLAIPRGDDDRIRGLIAAIAAKPFVILSGLSGSGKTQLAMRLGEWLGSGPKGPRFLTVPVRPDWTGPEALFGYEDALRPTRLGRAAWSVPSTLAFILRAHEEPSMPYLLLLDEMNLAHVERYFADFLSGIESRQELIPSIRQGTDGEWRIDDAASAKRPLPRNLIVIGTVNVDETTYQFSPKVLDRAMTFEIRTATYELDTTLKRPRAAASAERDVLTTFASIIAQDDWPAGYDETVEKTSLALRRLHELLSATGDEFGHRTHYEAIRLAVALRQLGLEGIEPALDQIVMRKILPRMHGSRRRTEPVLTALLAFAHSPLEPGHGGTSASGSFALPVSAAKIRRMLAAVAINQFVSFMD